MKISSGFATALAALATTSCAGGAFDMAAKHEALRNYQGADSGFIVVSAGAINGSIFSYSFVTFRRRNTEELFSFGYSPKRALLPGGDAADFESPKQGGVVVVKRLPPGEYEIYSADGVQYGKYEYHCTKKFPPAVMFTVRPGEVSYLGRYIITSWRGNCLALSISEEEQADVSIAKSRVSNLPIEEVHAFIPPVEKRNF